jgi:hypothetical protein
MWHGIELYPLTLVLDKDTFAELAKDRLREIADDAQRRAVEKRMRTPKVNTKMQAGTEEIFVKELGRIFASKKTRKVIAAILAQSAARITLPSAARSQVPDEDEAGET